MINVFQPSLYEESFDLLRECQSKSWLGKGELSDRFLSQIQDFFHTQNIGLASCASDCIFAVLAALNFVKGSKVALPVNSFPAVINAILVNGLEPVYIDIDPATGNICLESFSQRAAGCSVVFITHYGGTPVDVDALRRLCGRDVYILEDSACAFGSQYSKGVHVGLKGDFSCWSFDSMKLVTCGEGGAFFCKDDTLFARIKQQLYLGLPLKAKTGLDSAASVNRWWDYDIELPGLRSVFTDINASIGIPNLNRVNEKLNRLREIRMMYEEGLKVDFIRQDISIHSYSNYFFTIFVGNRDILAKKLLDKGVYSTLRYSRIDKMSISKQADIRMEGADFFYENALNIPMHAMLSDEDVLKVIKLINE